MPSPSASALGYDLNTVEFAVEDGIPYAIDFMNPAPDADLPLRRQRQASNGSSTKLAKLAVKKAQSVRLGQRQIGR